MKKDEAYPIIELSPDQFPVLIQHMNDPPKKLYARKGRVKEIEHEEHQEVEHQDESQKFLCVVGSRKYTSYGEGVCLKLISQLQGYNITIVSGLAYGIDSIAHRAALDAGLTTIAVLGSGLDWDTLYPRAHKALAERILDAGGMLISEEEPHHRARPYNFPKRNRIMAGMCHAVLVIESELKSGTLITSKYATEYNRDVLAVPGSIFSKRSEGPHMLLRLGATPVCTGANILEVLGLNVEGEREDVREEVHGGVCALSQKKQVSVTADERVVLDMLGEAPRTRNELIVTLTNNMQKNVADINALLVMMEIKDLITEKMGQMYLV